MSRVWSIIAKSTNRQVISWIGGALVALAGAAWTVVTYVWPVDEALCRQPSAEFSQRIIRDMCAPRRKIGFVTTAGLLVALFPISADAADPTISASDCAIASGHDVQ